MVDIVHDLLARDVGIRSISHRIDPSTHEVRMELHLMATFAEYERELIQECVQAGVHAAKARCVRLGRPAPDPQQVARNLRTVQHFIENEGLGVVGAARTVGWSEATYYRHRTNLGAGM